MEVPQVIPAQAVEAAAEGIYATAYPGGNWDSRPDRHIRYLQLATNALEAAAPYMRCAGNCANGVAREVDVM